VISGWLAVAGFGYTGLGGKSTDICEAKSEVSNGVELGEEKLITEMSERKL
jgi:hypothetical protein